MVDITTNAGSVADSFEKLSATFIDAIVKDGVWETLPVIASGARTVHRHVRRTGKLERSIKTSKDKLGGKVYTDDTYCDYSKFVHLGQRTWKPDEFIFESFDRNEKILDRNIDKAIDNVLRKARI